MFKFYTNRNFYFLLTAGILCFFISYYFDKKNSPSILAKEKHYVIHQIENNLNDELDAMRTIFASRLGKSDIDELNRNKKFSLQVYKSDSLIYWNNNSIETLLNKNLPIKYGIKKLNNGYFLIGTQNRNDTSFVLFYLIKSNFIRPNTYLKNNLNPDFEIENECALSLSKIDGFNEVSFNEGLHFYVKAEFSQNYPKIDLWLFLVGLVLICISLKYILNDLFKIDYVLGLSFLILFGILVRIFMVSFHFPKYLYSTELFDSHYFATSEFLQSLGDLGFTVLAICAAIAVSSHYLNKLKLEGKLKISLIGKALLLIYIIASAYLTFIVIRYLVVDSKILFDLTNVYSLTWLSLVGVVIVLLMYIICINLAYVYSKECFTLKPLTKGHLFQFLAVALIIFIASNFQGKAVAVYWEKIATSIFFLLLIALARSVLYDKSFIVRQLSYSLIFVIVAAFVFYNDGIGKERSERSSYAMRLTTQIDYRTEEILNSKESEITADTSFVIRCIENKLSNEEATQYITGKYINSYLEKYDCEVYMFLNDSANSTSFDYTATSLDYIFKNQGVKGLNDNFRFVKSPAEFFGYIGKFEYVLKNTNIKLFILLKLQPYQEDNLLPILLTEKSNNSKKNKLRYSYAIYSKNKLMQQAGKFQYLTQFNFDSITSPSTFITYNNYSHLLFKDSDDLVVVVSIVAPSILSVFAISFCLYFIILILGAIIMFLDFLLIIVCQFKKSENFFKKINLAIEATSKKYDVFNFKFSTRIIINILGLVLFIFTATSILTLQYIEHNISDQATTDLISKLRSINQYFTVDHILEGNSSPENIEVNLIKAANLFSTDINIYDVQGQLYSSSRPEIFKAGYLGNNINYDAFQEIVTRKASLYTKNESIGELQYTSYYQPYFDQNRNLKYIINTPYFAKTLEHHAQISMFIVNFLNLYVLLLLILLIIAYFVAQGTTKPFILLRDKIKSLRLDKENELLSWQRNDEIGELIKQYNSMVLDLKESKLNLANAERTEAWREMAKQVAHDIKNPLTPMKLNLQFLQRALEENDEDLPRKFRNISKSLITQIDSLSEMANNFSNFAKVPDSSPQVLNLNEEIAQIAELYRATDFVEITIKSLSNAQVLMDKNHFSRVIGNILKNAIQSIPNDRLGKIEIEISHTQVECLITIKDNGSGISKEMEHLIFIPNFSTKTSGSGIGLSITKTLIENAGGSISFISTSNEGTVFFIKLPLFKKE